MHVPLLFRCFVVVVVVVAAVAVAVVVVVFSLFLIATIFKGHCHGYLYHFRSFLC